MPTCKSIFNDFYCYKENSIHVSHRSNSSLSSHPLQSISLPFPSALRTHSVNLPLTIILNKASTRAKTTVILHNVSFIIKHFLYSVFIATCQEKH